MDKADDIASYDGNLAKQWHDAIQLAGKRQKTWEKKGEKVVDRYRDERPDADTSKRFNILWSNVETLRPSLYAQQPKPEVTRRYKDKDPIGRQAAIVLERALEYGVDAYDFDSVMHSCVEDYLLPGRGVARVRYKPTYGPEENGFKPVVYEEAECEYQNWKDFRHGPGRTWEEVSWVAFRSFLTKEELRKRFGKQAKEVELDYKPDDEDENEQFKKAVVWEIWDKTSKKVIWIAQSLADKVLDVKPPILNLQGFFPCPRPLYSLVTNNDLTPVPDYVEYQDQADELDELSGRIGALTKALKVVGLYAGDATSVARMLNEGNDNQLIPVDNWQMFADNGGISGMVDWFPVEQVGKVLVGLYEARDRTKQELYEITGLSDLIRGASDPGETATAQKIKGQFASMRLQERQQRVAIFARDLLRLKAEVMCEQFQPETLQMMTGIEMPKQEWAQVVELLRSDPLRTYRIDIETESTVKVDEDAERASRLEFVNTIGEFLVGAVPFMAENPEVAPLANEMLMFAIRGFKVGRQLEGAFEEAVGAMAQKKTDDPRLAQSQQTIQQLQQIAQQLQAKLKEVTEGREAQIHQVDMQGKVIDLEGKRADLQSKKTPEATPVDPEINIEELIGQQAAASADIEYKKAQTNKLRVETQGKAIENYATENNLVPAGDEGQPVMVEKPKGAQIIRIERTDSGLSGEIENEDGEIRRVVVNRTEDGMEGYVEGEEIEVEEDASLSS